MLEQRYSAHFRLHKRFSSEGDRVAHVEVEVLQPARNGTILQEPSKRESFASEASAYEWMDCKLRLNPINSTPPLARKPASMFGAHSFPQQTPLLVLNQAAYGKAAGGFCRSLFLMF